MSDSRWSATGSCRIACSRRGARSFVPRAPSLRRAGLPNLGARAAGERAAAGVDAHIELRTVQGPGCHSPRCAELTFRVDLVNELPESTTIHWHGLHVPEAMGGHPRHAIAFPAAPPVRFQGIYVIAGLALTGHGWSCLSG